jgi:hypothetical protein
MMGSSHRERTVQRESAASRPSTPWYDHGKWHFQWRSIRVVDDLSARSVPDARRSSAISLVCNSSRILAALGPLLTGWLVSSFGGIGSAAAMISLIYVVGLVVTPFAGPEPRAGRCRSELV